MFKFYWAFPDNSKVPTVILTVLFLVFIMFSPFNFLYRVARFEIIKVLGHIIISPFGLVKFRDFFLADVITSARLMLSDSTSMVCFYTSKEFLIETDPITCSW